MTRRRYTVDVLLETRRDVTVWAETPGQAERKAEALVRKWPSVMRAMAQGAEEMPEGKQGRGAP